ncbi:hypothetical protein Nepgr_003018 [Nepenthes gracilis]|uniref:Uncharacterized protein n=1 Tax=Nepenthes gracilis TaxID=150966 RepID=A0AAD3RYQ6_NEPGR|nr:hypothetical protein Nepgr_003018 [Nepenthes gracilis]
MTVLGEVIEPREAEAAADVTAEEIFDLLGGEEAMTAALEVPVVTRVLETAEPSLPRTFLRAILDIPRPECASAPGSGGDCSVTDLSCPVFRYLVLGLHSCQAVLKRL